MWQRVPLHKFFPGQWRLSRAHTEVLQLQRDSEGLWPRQQDALWNPCHRPRAQGVRWVPKARYVELPPLTCCELSYTLGLPGCALMTMVGEKWEQGMPTLSPIMFAFKKTIFLSTRIKLYGYYRRASFVLDTKFFGSLVVAFGWFWQMRPTADPWLQEGYSQDCHESLSWATQMDLWFLICSAWSPHINPLLYSLGFSGSLWTNGVLINPSQLPYMIIHNFSLPKNVVLILNYASVFLCCRAIGEPMYVIT